MCLSDRHLGRQWCVGLNALESSDPPTLSKNRAAMMKFPLPLLAWAACVALGLPQLAHALASDRNQPMHIEADGLRHDEAAQETVFSGNVVVTKGTIVLRGDTLSVQQRADGSQFGTVQGSGKRRAFFSQQRDTPKGAPVETVEAEATRIEYDSRSDQIKLVGQAQLRRLQAGRLNDEINGGVVVYNNASGTFTVDGAARSAGQSGQGRSSGRVRAVIGATTASGGAGASGASGASGTSGALQPSSRLGGANP